MADAWGSPELAETFAKGVIERCTREINKATDRGEAAEWRKLRAQARRLRRAAVKARAEASIHP